MFLVTSGVILKPKSMLAECFAKNSLLTSMIFSHLGKIIPLELLLLVSIKLNECYLGNTITEDCCFALGQVHKAVLRQSGEVVAVKVLCPGMESKFRADIRTLKAFCQLAMPQHVTAFAEIEKQFCTGWQKIFSASIALVS